MTWFLLLLGLTPALAASQADAFLIQVGDRSFTITAPAQKRALFSVIVENRSLSDLLGKFTANGKNLKFVAVRSGTSEAVEVQNGSSAPVVFVPVSPAFQDVELVFGKKAYEIPAKD